MTTHDHTLGTQLRHHLASVQEVLQKVFLILASPNQLAGWPWDSPHMIPSNPRTSMRSA